LGETIRSAMQHMDSYKPSFSRTGLVKLFASALLLALAYWLAFGQRPQTFSITIKPCGEVTRAT